MLIDVNGKPLSSGKIQTDDVIDPSKAGFNYIPRNSGLNVILFNKITQKPEFSLLVIMPTKKLEFYQQNPQYMEYALKNYILQSYALSVKKLDLSKEDLTDEEVNAIGEELTNRYHTQVIPIGFDTFVKDVFEFNATDEEANQNADNAPQPV